MWRECNGSGESNGYRCGIQAEIRTVHKASRQESQRAGMRMQIATGGASPTQDFENFVEVQVAVVTLVAGETGCFSYIDVSPTSSTLGPPALSLPDVAWTQHARSHSTCLTLRQHSALHDTLLP